MFRNFALAAILTLTAAGAAQAADLTARIHQAAVMACAPQSSASLPLSHYQAITQACIDQVSLETARRLHALELARTQASTAALVN